MSTLMEREERTHGTSTPLMDSTGSPPYRWAPATSVHTTTRTPSTTGTIRRVWAPPPTWTTPRQFGEWIKCQIESDHLKLLYLCCPGSKISLPIPCGSACRGAHLVYGPPHSLHRGEGESRIRTADSRCIYPNFSNEMVRVRTPSVTNLFPVIIPSAHN